MNEQRIVRLRRDMRPWRAGQDAVVPESMVDELLKAGAIENVRPFPPPDVAPAVKDLNPERPALRRPRPYFTRKRG